MLVELARSDSVGGLVEDVLREGLGEYLGVVDGVERERLARSGAAFREKRERPYCMRDDFNV